MDQEPQRSDASNPAPGQFPQTRWSMVLAACDAQGGERARAALDELCRAYWFPLYAYIRRRGNSAEDAEDLTQGYFAALIEREYLAQADRTKGRLRTFLLTTLKHFLADHWSKVNTQKRGMGKTIVSIDAAAAEERYAMEPADEAASPDVQYERGWAFALLDQVLGRLQRDYEAKRMGPVFRELQRFLAWNSAGEAYREAAEALAMKESAVRVAIFRLRRRYGDLLRETVAETVTSPEEVTEELDYLLNLLRS